MRLLSMVAGKMVRAEWIYNTHSTPFISYLLTHNSFPYTMIISNMISLLPLLAVGVFAETSKPNTGDQTLGKSPFPLLSSFPPKLITRIHIRILNLLPHSPHNPLMSRPTHHHTPHRPRHVRSGRYSRSFQHVVFGQGTVPHE